MKKHKLSWKAIAGEFLVVLIVLPFLISGLGVVALALQPLFSGESSAMEFLPSVVLAPLGLLLLLISIVLCLLPFGRAAFSYLTVSDAGIDYRYWPIHRIQCKWDDVDQIYKSPLPFQGDMLKLKRGDVSGFHVNLSPRQGKFGIIKTIPVIPLYQFAGWVNRELETDLRDHAPNLFVNLSSK